MTVEDIKIYELENGNYVVEYNDENHQKVVNEFENSLLATQFFNTLITTT